MQFKLRNATIPGFSAIEQVLFNRGIAQKDFLHYLHTTDSDIAHYSCFGDSIYKAARALVKAIADGADAWVIVDCDCDGMTSAALLINYLHRSFPAWVENHLSWYLHPGKQHGLSDFDYMTIVKSGDLIICPDSSSNDYEIHQKIAELDGLVVVLDHHEAEKISENAIIVNNQLSDYPNKNLSGVGVTWQFCRLLDEMMSISRAEDYLDLVAIGLVGDMMDIRSFETCHLIKIGLDLDNFHNPFLYELACKNKFSLGSFITPIGAAFYIVPFINSMMRSGTLEEKQLMFESMLDFKAYKEIPSTKRGHQPGEMEKVVTQAVRVATNVKNRQTKAQDVGMEMLEDRIAKEGMLKDKALVFYLEKEEIDRNIAGLCANKLMAKYQRPCCILTKVSEPIEGQPLDESSYQGSARGYTKTGLLDFKEVCSKFSKILYCEGHANAFGLGIPEDFKEEFKQFLNNSLSDLPTEPVYYVDYIYDNVNVNAEQILDLSRYISLWGQELEEPLVAIKGLKISSKDISIKSPDKSPTLVISLSCGVELIKFKVSELEIEYLLGTGDEERPPYFYLNVVGKCQKNEWGGRITPQIKIEDCEITGYSNYDF